MARREIEITGGQPLLGRIRMPGCKGISHRALVFAAVADGTSELTGLAPGADVGHTRSALGALGVEVANSSADASGAVVIEGRGFDGLEAPSGVIDCGNSGTTMRLLSGLLAGRPFAAVLDGDSSLRSRPMGRVIAPLRLLGADIDGADHATHAPLTLAGAELGGTRVELEVASGQVKTALILAGLQASGTTEIIEPAPSRDHTERMLRALGVPIGRPDATTVTIRAGAVAGFQLEIPGDPSSAAFFVVAATIVAGSSVVIEGVGINPGRMGYLDVLRAMGATITTTQTGERLGEPVGDIAVEAASLHGVEIESREAIVDELPVLAVAAAFAEGITTIGGASELAVKESNRIVAISTMLSNMGISAEVRPDGLVVHGGRPKPGRFESYGDHRMAMTAAVAAVGTAGASTVDGWAIVSVSYPHFAEDLARLGGRL